MRSSVKWEYGTIGDIHGCLRALERLIERISPGEYDKLIFLGDYIDRGPDAKGVVDFLLQLSRRTQCVFLRGNHEQMLLDVIDNNDDIFLWNLKRSTGDNSKLRKSYSIRNK